MKNISADHDLIVILTEKVENLAREMRLANDGTKERISSLETKMAAVEGVIDRTNLETSYRDFLTIKQEVHDFKTTATAYRVMAGIIGGIIFFLITQFPLVLKSWGIIH